MIKKQIIQIYDIIGNSVYVNDIDEPPNYASFIYIDTFKNFNISDVKIGDTFVEILECCNILSLIKI